MKHTDNIKIEFENILYYLWFDETLTREEKLSMLLSLTDGKGFDYILLLTGKMLIGQIIINFLNKNDMVAQ